MHQTRRKESPPEKKAEEEEDVAAKSLPESLTTLRRRTTQRRRILLRSPQLKRFLKLKIGAVVTFTFRQRPSSGSVSGMLFNTHTISQHLNKSRNKTTIRAWIQFTASISSLKVVWRKDRELDEAIVKDKTWRQCVKVVKEVLNEPGQVIPLRYLKKRRERLRLPIKIQTFLSRNPGLFDVYYDRIKPKSEPVKFLRVSDKLQQFLEDEKRINMDNESLIVSRLCKLLMMSKDKVVSADKLVHVKREFGFPNDFLENLVPKYPNYFNLIEIPGEGKSFLELVSWNPNFAKSVIEQRADKESEMTGIRIRPSFDWKLPPGFFIRKEMREWIRDWMELPYISPYDDASHLNQASREMEKRTVGVFHELLSLSLHKRIPVPILGKFTEEYRFSNAFSSVFTRHSGLFYMSLKGGIKTAMLREAYKKGELIDRDPLLEIKDKFIELLAEGYKERAEQMVQKEVQNEMEMAENCTYLDESDYLQSSFDCIAVGHESRVQLYEEE